MSILMFLFYDSYSTILKPAYDLLLFLDCKNLLQPMTSVTRKTHCNKGKALFY